MLDDKLRECLTFDDVLLAPGVQRGPAQGRRRQDAALPRRIELNIPLLSAAMDSVTEAARPSPWPARAASASCTRTCPIEAQAREVERVKRAESGMIARPVTARPDAVAARGARDDARARHQRRARRRGRAPGRHPHRARHPLRAEPRPARQRAHDQGARHRAAGRLATTRQASCCTSTASRSCSSSTATASSSGLITIKDILQADRNPQANKDEQRRLRVGAAIGPGPDRARAHRRPRRRRRRRHRRSTPRTATRRASSTPCARRRKSSPTCSVIAGNVATAEAHRGPHRRRRRRA